MSKVKISEIINENFKQFWVDANKGKYLYYVHKGGRASAKSTHIALWLVKHIMQDPVTILCIRKVGNTLKESVYEQIKEAIEFMGVSHLFIFKQSPLEIIYKPRGNKFIFRGCDKPEKIKSIKMSKFPITTLFAEEIAEFKTEQELSTVVKSVIRAELPEGLRYRVFYAYNPPKRKQNWCNKMFESQFISKNTRVYHSTYLENKHISKAFIEEAEEIKQMKPIKYRFEYLGEPIGSGVVPFDNLVFKEITNSEIRQFDNIRQGLDFGLNISSKYKKFGELVNARCIAMLC